MQVAAIPKRPLLFGATPSNPLDSAESATPPFRFTARRHALLCAGHSEKMGKRKGMQNIRGFNRLRRTTSMKTPPAFASATICRGLPQGIRPIIAPPIQRICSPRQYSMSNPIARLYINHVGEIRRFLVRRTSCAEAAVELAQEVFIRFMVTDTRPAVNNQRAFLFRIAENLAIDYFRANAKRNGNRVDLSACEEIASDAPGPERYAIARQQLAQLREAIDELPPRCKEVFVRHKFDDRPQKELAIEYGVTLNAIEKLLVRALVHLRIRVELE